MSEDSGQLLDQSRILQHPPCPKTLYLHSPKTAQTEGRLVSVGFLASGSATEVDILGATTDAS